jgi:3-dehydroquinate synthase
LKELTVSFGTRSYDVSVGRGALAAADSALFTDGVAVTDEKVYKLYKVQIESLVSSPERVAVVPVGEGSKSPERLSWLWRFFARAGLRRRAPVIAFGGGVVGDLAGFAAATYMRGAPLIQIPTTLLSQTDSSVGGKVAVNLPEGKNLAGSFHQPRAVIADTAFLDTLPDREIKAGMGEVVKHALLDGGALLRLLQDGSLDKDRDEIVFENIKIKAAIVQRDERESDKGARMTLNLGHTFGHALEAYTLYSRYNHGEAVAIGTALAVRAGIALGLTSPETLELLHGLLRRYNMPYETEIPACDFIPLMLGDKKNQVSSGGDEVTLVLLRNPGEPFVHSIKLKELESVFMAC